MLIQPVLAASLVAAEASSRHQEVPVGFGAQQVEHLAAVASGADQGLRRGATALDGRRGPAAGVVAAETGGGKGGVHGVHSVYLTFSLGLKVQYSTTVEKKPI